MLHFLHDNPLMLLFVVAAVGYPLGRIRIAGTGLGVAAVLFAGLAVGALDPAARLPEEFTQLGLVLFVYTLGLSCAPAFLAALRRNGVRDNLLTAGVLAGAGAVAAGVHGLLGLRPTQTAGLFAGALTNTPALAAVIEHIRRDAPADQAELLLGDPVAAYSAAYPVGVIGMIGALVLARRLWRVDFSDEARRLRSLGVGGAELVNRTLCVTRPEAADAPIASIARGHDWHVVFGRVEHGGVVSLADGATRFALGDRVSVIGPPDEVARVADFLGEVRPEPLDTDGGGFEYRLVFVSSPEIAGRTLKELDVRHRLGALVTRVRRGDSEIAGLGRQTSGSRPTTGPAAATAAAGQGFGRGFGRGGGDEAGVRLVTTGGKGYDNFVRDSASERMNMPTKQRQIWCGTCRTHTLATREGVHHILHAVITLFLCGLWLPIWILAAMSVGPFRCTRCGASPAILSQIASAGWSLLAASAVLLIALVALAVVASTYTR
jgi:AspT/YidE/YbjL antiporter-like protein